MRHHPEPCLLPQADEAGGKDVVQRGGPVQHGEGIVLGVPPGVDLGRAHGDAAFLLIKKMGIGVFVAKNEECSHLEPIAEFNERLLVVHAGDGVVVIEAAVVGPEACLNYGNFISKCQLWETKLFFGLTEVVAGEVVPLPVDDFVSPIEVDENLAPAGQGLIEAIAMDKHLELAKKPNS